MPHQSYESYLQQALSKYRNPDSTKRDVLSTVQHYRGLFPKLEMFVFNDGTQKELLNLDGTVPVPYKGNTYNIPVCIWMLDSYPYNAPMCYVKPTSDMQIKVSRHVDHTGKVYLPYLHEWKHNSSDLLGLIQVMIIVFGEQPPVYSRQRSHSEHQSQPQPQSQPPPLLPPSTQGHTTNAPYPTGTQAYMPLPAVSNSGSVPSQPPPPYAYTPSHYQPSAMYPPPPGYGYQGVGGHSTGGMYPSYPPVSGAVPYPHPHPYPPITSAYQQTPYPAYPPTAGLPQQSVLPPVPPPPSNNSTITEEHIRVSLLSAVEDKMKRRLREIFAQAQAEMDVLKRTQDDLNCGKAKLENMIERLEQEQIDLEKNVVVLQEKNEAMNELITKMQSQEAIDVDEAVVTVAPLYKQLLNAFAEENAIEDAIYYLGEALRKQVIDIDVFLKHVRELSRRQFMLRALVQKCREKANLPC